MSEVQRFRCYTEEAKSGSYGSMGESDQGDWVRFEDYERDVSSLRMELRGLLKSCLSGLYHTEACISKIAYLNAPCTCGRDELSVRIQGEIGHGE